MAARLAWGIMGCGWVARDYAGPAIASSSNGRVAALYDPDQASLTKAAALFPEAATHSDLTTFLATPGLGAAYVAAPNHVHRPLVEAAAGAGLAVLCEKPMATTMADAEAMVEACRRAGVDPADIVAFVPHQANLRIIDALVRRVGLPNAVIARDIITSGNTSAATIPLALSRMVEAGEIPSAAPVLLLGFGSGLAYAGQVVLSP